MKTNSVENASIVGARGAPRQADSARVGWLAEQKAARFLMEQGLQVVVRNHRCRQGEVDLICRQGSVLVFVEVRLRRRGAPVGAGESIDLFKQARIRHAALHYLSQLGQMPPCRFDAVLFEGASIQWLQNILE